MPEFSGEQKLRIVLESIIRKVPSAEQCEKYGISEQEFQSWQDHLTANGGKIFEPGFELSTKSRRRSPSNKKGGIGKVLLSLSLLANLAAVTVISVHFFKESNRPEIANSIDETIPVTDSPLHFAQPDNDFTDPLEDKPTVANSELNEELPLPVQNLESGQENPMANLETLLAKPMELPNAKILPPVDTLPDISSEVSFLGKIYEGRHVVFVVDVGDYVLQGDGAGVRFEKMKDAVLSSLATLSPNSYFNIVLYWNLRECSALGKTILKANRENIKLAIDWIAGLGSSLEDLKVNRNQFVPKELLYSKPLAGVVGPWFGLSLGISFDPDLIFLIGGNSPKFSMKAIPKSHFNGLDLSQRSLLNGSSITGNDNAGSASIGNLTRKTARLWLTSIEPPGALPENYLEVEKIALRRLGLNDENFIANQSISIPWEKVFENFLGSLEVNAQMIPQSHFFLCLPDDVRWPNDLLNTAAEFAESSKGTLVENPEFR